MPELERTLSEVLAAFAAADFPAQAGAVAAAADAPTPALTREAAEKVRAQGSFEGRGG